MIDADKIDDFANKLENNPSDMQQFLKDNSADESDLLKDLEKEVTSPFLKENRRTSTAQTHTEEKPKEESKENEDSKGDDGDFSFEDLEDEEKKDDENEDSKQFSKDVVSFIINALDYGIDKGSQAFGYEVTGNTSDLNTQKDLVIQYGAIVFDKYNFKITPEHMLLFALVFYLKAKVSQMKKKGSEDEKDKKDNSHLKLVKPYKEKPKPNENDNQEKGEENKSKKATVKESVL